MSLDGALRNQPPLKVATRPTFLEYTLVYMNEQRKRLQCFTIQGVDVWRSHSLLSVCVYLICESQVLHMCTVNT